MKVDETELDRVEAIILSMTPEERRRPELIKGSRRLRIAKGSGTTVQQVNQLVKQFGQMRKMMKRRSSRARCPISAQLMRRAAERRATASYRYPARADRWPSACDSPASAGRRTPSGASSSPTSAPRATAAFIETLGRYNAADRPLDDRARRGARPHWLARGAQPSDTVRKLLKTQGIDAPSASAPCASCSSTSPGRSSTSPTRSRSRSSRRTTARSCSSCPSPTTTTAQVIGRGGRTAQALRTVVKAAAVKDNRRVLVDIVE